MPKLMRDPSFRSEVASNILGTNSAGGYYSLPAHQYIGFNNAERLHLAEQMPSAFMVAAHALLESTEGAMQPETMWANVLEGIGTPARVARTMQTLFQLHRGRSSTANVLKKLDQYEGGAVFVYSEDDGFPFFERANQLVLQASGVKIVTLPNHGHNSLTQRPEETIDLLTPSIFPPAEGRVTLAA